MPDPDRPALSRRVAAEAIAVFALVFCVGEAAAEEALATMAVATDTRAAAAAAIAIGGVVLLEVLVRGAVSRSSMKPARSFGPALASGTWSHFWIWVVGPLVGTANGAFAYQLVRAPHTPRAGQAA